MPRSDLPEKIAFVDIETTGGSQLYNRVIEIGIIRVELDHQTNQYQVTQTFQSLVNPGQHIPPEIVVLTGIDISEVEKAPFFYELQGDILEILENCYFVAHNVRFDYSFLKQEFRRLEKTFAPKHFCTVKLSRKLYPQHRHHNLDSIIDRFGFSIQSRHRAFDDAMVLWQFWQAILNEFSADLIIEALNHILKKPTLPINLTDQQLQQLPESPGVYLFYGDNNNPLYIGKSINIKERVMSHFAADHSSPKEMQISQQIKRIETIKTSGELGALLKEARLVKQLQPLYNSQLRVLHKLAIIIKVQDKDKYHSTHVELFDHVPTDQLDDILGIFGSVKKAKNYLIKVAEEHQLCEKKLGLETTPGSCFAYRLGRCRGACVAKEHPLNYNLRFYNAFANIRLRPWPYDGPIIITEQDPENDQTEQFIVDKWCLLDSADSEIQFDLDAYKILNAYIRSSKHLKNIKTLSKSKFNQIIAQKKLAEEFVSDEYIESP